MTDPFAGDHFVIRQQVFSLLHTKFHVYDQHGQLLLFCKMKGFKLKEDIRLFSDETESTELISIQARSILDFSAGYDVVDSQTGQRLGVLRRKGMMSTFVRDSWELLTPDERPLGTITEDSTLKALVRRFIDMASFLMPQSFHVDISGVRAATFKQNFNPFVKKLNVDFETIGPVALDRKLGLAAGILVMAIEGRQE
ncbi:MAG TPA: hypothetical protein VF595_02935 [Tepidisphaeraceae bacterium]|jgi:uncharacterized protein YxjI